MIHRKRKVGQVTVTLATPTTPTSVNIWWVALPLAFLVSGLILGLPWWAAQSADRINMTLWRRLTDFNQTLELRVHKRTQELSEMNQRLLTIQEEERLRISRDLHDELGQTLTGLRLQLTRAEILNQEDNVDEALKQALEVIDLGVDQVRRIAYEQRPPELDMLGLYDALRALVKRSDIQEDKHISLQVPSTSPDPPLPSAVNVCLFRVAQEGITNALRHSGTDIVMVSLTLDHQEVTLKVIDHGHGQPDQLVWGGGLSGAHGRLHRIGGRLQVTQTLSGGLTLIATIPLDSPSL